MLACALWSGWSSASASDSGEITEDVMTEPTQSRRPNIVLILADDLDFTDIAPYGSEINTPSLTALAEAGVSFTNYHTAANCAPAPCC